MSYAKLAQEIATTIALGMTPAGVAIDLKDTLFAAYYLYEEHDNEEYQFEMVVCLLGWIPGPGDGLKAGLRGINRYPELLFDMVRLILQETGVHADAEKWLEEMLQVNRVRGVIRKAKGQTIQYIKDSNKIWDGIIPYVSDAFDFVEKNLASIMMIVIRKVAGWKKKVPRTTQRNAAATKSSGHNAAQGKVTRGKTGSEPEKKESSGKQSGVNASRIIKKLNNADIGIVGEHMADYWVAKQWGIGVTHDNEHHERKISQSGKLHKLDLANVTGTGIDSVWKSNNQSLDGQPTKSYAIIEAKCSGTKALATLPSLLGDNTPKAGTGNSSSKRGGTQSKATKKASDQQMSKEWVNDRLVRAGAGNAKNSYSRHVVFFGLIKNPTVLEHFNAIKSNPGAPIASQHANHKPTQTFNEAQIDKAIKERIERSKKR